MSFADKLNEAVNQVLIEYDLKHLKLEDEIIITDLKDRVGIELVSDSDEFAYRSVNLLIDLPAIIATGEPITAETFKPQIISQLGQLGIIPKHIFVAQFARPFVSEHGDTVIIGMRDASGEVTILEIPTRGVEFIMGELQKILT